MPINISRRLTGTRRSDAADTWLGFVLTFIAGAINAGGFLAVSQYTSHMTGIVSSMADGVVLGAYQVVGSGAAAVVSFLAGAACSSLMIISARSKAWTSAYALPLLLEAFLLMCFGMLGSRLAAAHGLFVPVTVMLLCFIMGLQNALLTKVSSGTIRTTHLTGTVTDIGVELGRLAYSRMPGRLPARQVSFDSARLRRLALMATLFLCGGIVGAFAFKYIGYRFTVPLALALIALSVGPAGDDIAKAVRARMAAGRLNEP